MLMVIDFSIAIALRVSAIIIDSSALYINPVKSEQVLYIGLLDRCDHLGRQWVSEMYTWELVLDNAPDH